MSFNPLEHRVCFSFPERDVASAWTEHIPFGMLLVDLVRPGTLVELGTYLGASYCAFCQAVKELSLDTRCFAVDNFEGDLHGGFYGPEVLSNLKAHHDPRYATFSQLITSSFDDALRHFGAGAIDLLHIDGYHTYEAVKHDFDNWLPKMSERGIIILHDVAERAGDFGVWRLWEELKDRYPHAEIYHGHGLGLVAVGSVIPEGLRSLLELHEELWPAVRELFHELGVRIESRQTERTLRKQIDQVREDATTSIREHAQEHAQQTAILQGQIAQGAAELATVEARELAERDAIIARYEAIIARYEDQLARIRQQTAEEHAALTLRYNTAIAAAQSRSADIDRRLNETVWQLKWLESSRGVRLVKLARASRAVLKHKGPLSLTKHVLLWSLGKRGYHLRDIQATTKGAQSHSSPIAAAQTITRGQKMPKQSAFSGVSIIIPVFNALDYAKACIESVYRVGASISFEVIVIDNGSRSEVLHWLETESKRRENLWYVSLSENLGFAKAINLGMQTARGQYIVLQNSDTIATTGWLDNLVNAADKDPSIGIVSPVTNYVGQGPQIDPAAVALPVEHAEQYARRIRDRAGLLYAPERLVFFCVLLKRQVVNLLGVLDEGFGLGNFEDEDYSVRARVAGFRLAIAQNSFVYHHGSKTFQTNNLDHTGLMVGNYHRYLNRLAIAASSYLPGHTRPKVARPEVSVIIRTVNRPDTLKTALTSLANQTFDRFEVVLVNDAGQDVADLVEEFDDRLTVQYVRHNERKGAGEALNTGANSARGRYLCYLDDDDVVYPFHLEALWRELVDNDGRYKFVYSDYNRALMSGRGAEATAIARVPVPTWEFNRDQLLVQNYIAIHTWMHDRDCVEAVGGFDKDLLILQDWDFLIRLSAQHAFHPIRRISCEYRFYIDQGNSIVRGRSRSLEEMATIFMKYPVTDPRLLAEREQGVAALREQVSSTNELQRLGESGAMSHQDATRKILAQLVGFPLESY